METAILIAICTGIVQIIKQMPMPKYAVRLIALVVGVGLAFIVKQEVASILTGLIIGLSSTGLYELTVKPTVEKFSE